MNGLRKKIIMFIPLLMLATFPSTGQDLQEDSEQTELMAGFPQVEAAAPSHVLSLSDCLHLALQNRRPEWDYQVEIYEGQALQASPSLIPHIQVEELVGPLPEKGNLSKIGILNRVKVTAGIPIYDFGRTKAFHKAALGRVNAETKLNVQKENQEIVEVTQLYYGLLFARETLNNLLDARGKVTQYRAIAEERHKRRKGELNRADLLQMDYEMLRLERQIAEAKGKADLAYAALAIKIGFDAHERFDIEDRFLRPLSVKLGNLDEYQDLAVRKRPEIAALDAGVEARKSLLSAEQKGFYPSTFFGGFIEKSFSSTRKDNDDFNYTHGGLGLAVNWTFDFNSTLGKVKSARSEYYKILEQRRLALPAIQLDVTRAYLEAERSQQDVERGRQTRKIGRALLFFAKSNWDIGIGDPLKLKDALIRFNEARFDHSKSILDFNVAVVKLSQAVGAPLVQVQ